MLCAMGCRSRAEGAGLDEIVDISVDDRPISRSDRAAVAVALAFFFVPYCLPPCIGIFIFIWREVLIGDYSRSQVYWNLLWTAILAPLFALFYGWFLWSVFEHSERTTIRVNRTDGTLLVLSGRRRDRRRLETTDLRGIERGEITRGEDNWVKLRLAISGKTSEIRVTSPPDCENPAAVTARLHAALAGLPADVIHRYRLPSSQPGKSAIDPSTTSAA